MRTPCGHGLGVARKADLLQLDGEHLREELADGGAWCTAEPHWAAMVRAKMGWHRSKADPAVAGVSGAVAQAMRYAGCPNRRSLSYK